MKKKYKIICFDIDNVICNTKKNYYKQSTPKKKVIKFINSLYDNGYFIKVFTARFMGRYKSKINAKKKGYLFTQNQLKKWGLKYNELIFGKPAYDVFIDDKNLGYSKNWITDLKDCLDD